MFLALASSRVNILPSSSARSWNCLPLAALDEVGTPVHEEFIWLTFVDNLLPGYEFIKNNLQRSEEPLTHIVLENALQSRYSVQSGGKKGRTIPDSALFVSGSKAGRGIGRGRSHVGTNEGKLDSRSRSEELSPQAKITCNHCQKPGHIQSNCPERPCFECQGWGHGVTKLPAHLRFRLRKRTETKRCRTNQLCYGGKSKTRFRGNN